MEVFVAGGQVAGLTAFAPAALANTHVHLFAGSGTDSNSDGSAGVQAQGVKVMRMGCGWNTSFVE